MENERKKELIKRISAKIKQDEPKIIAICKLMIQIKNDRDKEES